MELGTRAARAGVVDTQMQDAPPGAERGQGGVSDPCTGADYPAERSARLPVPRWSIAACAGIQDRCEDAAPPDMHRRMADTRVFRAPRFALQPRLIRSGGHSPTGRQAMKRPPPEDRSGCTRNDVSEIGMVT